MTSDVTRILSAIEGGDPKDADELLPLVYEESGNLAGRQISQERPGQTLQATALVHEAYVRLVEARDQNWNNRGHFFRAAAAAIRRIVVENAPRKKSVKGGGRYQRVDIDVDRANLPALTLPDESASEDILALNEALDRLRRKDPRSAELVKLRYFTGLSLNQAAEIEGISRRTATGWWKYARAWLYRELTGEYDSGL